MNKYALQGSISGNDNTSAKHLRSQGFIPATVYGKTIRSLSVRVAADPFRKIYADAGATGLIDLTVGAQTHPVLIQNVQRHPVTRDILNIEFHSVDLKEKVKAEIPVELTGEPAAVADRTGVLLQVVMSVEVEALPTDLPEKIIADVSGLAVVGEELKVGDLHVSGAVTILTGKDILVARISPLVSRDAEAQTQEDEQKAADATADAAAATGPDADAGKQPSPAKSE